MSKSILTPKHKNAWVSVLKVTAVFSQQIDAELKAAGHIAIDSYDALLALEDGPDGRLTMSELAATVVVSPSGVTRLIDRMVKDGYVTRTSNPVDRRSKYACITKKGLEARNAAWPTVKNCIEEFWVANMSEAEAGMILDIMKRMVVPKEYE